MLATNKQFPGEIDFAKVSVLPQVGLLNLTLPRERVSPVKRQ
jgi:hypothetical protein